MFEYTAKINMHHVDPAGIMFFGNQFKLMHDAYEAFMESRGLGLDKIIGDAQFHIPIVHTDADFHSPLRLGNTVRVKLMVKRKGTTSFTLAYKLYNKDILCGSGETVHVTIDPNTERKIPLPQNLLAIL
jgi:YbgC/YbaW family acyl-CoA thioester hydrolase